MKTKIELGICALFFGAYQIINLIIEGSSRTILGYEIVSVVLCLLGLLSFIFIHKEKRALAIIPLGIFIVGTLLSVDCNNLMVKAQLYESQSTNAGIFYVFNFVCDYVLLNLVYIAIMVNILLKDRIKLSVFIVLMIITIVSIATSFYHVPINGEDLATVALKIIGVYAPMFIYMKNALLKYDKLGYKKKELKEDLLSEDMEEA